MGANKRKYKLLAGIALGKWVVSTEWITKSVEANSFQSEKEFENTFFKGCKLARQAREAGKEPLFNGLKVCVLSKKQLKMPFEEFKWFDNFAHSSPYTA